MVYLLLGDDLRSKDAKIAQIRSKFFKDSQSLNFDLESLDAQGLPPDTLKKALITLPVISLKRLVLMRNIHKLKPADVLVLKQFLLKPADHLDLILESSETSFKGELKDIAAFCQTNIFDTLPRGNVFDMTKLMSSGRAKEALNMLSGFYAEGTHPLQIMGSLVWFWGKEGKVLKKDQFERGLKALEEADLNIKRSRLEPEYAVEKVVVELTGLLSSRR